MRETRKQPSYFSSAGAGSPNVPPKRCVGIPEQRDR